MTSKGTFTLLAKVRKELGLTKAVDRLILSYHAKNRVITMEKPTDLKAIQSRNAAFIKAKGIKPVAPEKLREIRDSLWTERSVKHMAQHG